MMRLITLAALVAVFLVASVATAQDGVPLTGPTPPIETTAPAIEAEGVVRPEGVVRSTTTATVTITPTPAPTSIRHDVQVNGEIRLVGQEPTERVVTRTVRVPVTRTRTVTRTVRVPGPTRVVERQTIIKQPAPTPAVNPAVAGKGGSPMEALMWILAGLILAIAVWAIIRAARECPTPTVIRPRESRQDATNSILPRRLAMAAPNAPAPIGPSTGAGGMVHYDEVGRVVGWEKWEYPAASQVRTIPGSVKALVVQDPGQPAQVIHMPPPFDWEGHTKTAPPAPPAPKPNPAPVPEKQIIIHGAPPAPKPAAPPTTQKPAPATNGPGKGGALNK